jgi:thiamine kinase-like enzyme
MENSFLRNRITNILAHLTNIRGSMPSPLSSRVSYSILWSKHSEEPSLHTIKDIENWFNMRLKKQYPKLIFSKSKLVLCHLDITPRNFLLLHDNSICLLN